MTADAVDRARRAYALDAAELLGQYARCRCFTCTDNMLAIDARSLDIDNAVAQHHTAPRGGR